MIRVVHPGSRSWFFYPSRIPDEGVKKAPDPGAGSATLFSYLAPRTLYLGPRTRYLGPRISHLVTRTSYHVFISSFINYHSRTGNSAAALIARSSLRKNLHIRHCKWFYVLQFISTNVWKIPLKLRKHFVLYENDQISGLLWIQWISMPNQCLPKIRNHVKF